MSNFKSGAQRYNDRMDKIWERARANGALCADRECKELKHGHVWMPTRGKVTR